MTEMLEKILTPLQKAARSEEAISEEVFDKQDKSTSTNSLHRACSREAHRKPGNRSGPLPPSTISPSFTSPYKGHNSTRACFRKLGSCYSWTMFRYEVSSLYIIFFSLDV